MREPHLHDDDGSDAKPFSQLPLEDLKEIAAGCIVPIATADDPDSDIDFAKHYATILLKERSNG